MAEQSDAFYYWDGKAAIGPRAYGEMLAAYKAKIIKDDTPVMRENEQSWLPLVKHPILARISVGSALDAAFGLDSQAETDVPYLTTIPPTVSSTKSKWWIWALVGLLACGYLYYSNTQRRHANNQAQPTASLDNALEEQRQVQASGDTLENRKAVRQAVLGHMSKYFPEWKVQGVTLYSYNNITYMCGVDSVSGEQRQTIFFSAGLFVKDTGEMYWKTEHTPPDKSARPFDFVTVPYAPPSRED